MRPKIKSERIVANYHEYKFEEPITCYQNTEIEVEVVVRMGELRDDICPKCGSRDVDCIDQYYLANNSVSHCYCMTCPWEWEFHYKLVSIENIKRQDD